MALEQQEQLDIQPQTALPANDKQEAIRWDEPFHVCSVFIIWHQTEPMVSAYHFVELVVGVGDETGRLSEPLGARGR